jgi:hypothetical protein
MAGPAVALIIMKQRDVAEAFERAGATVADRAIAPEKIQVATHGIVWRLMTHRALVREASPGLWYLDHSKWIALRQARKKSLWLLLIIAAVVAYSLFAASHRDESDVESDQSSSATKIPTLAGK